MKQSEVSEPDCNTKIFPEADLKNDNNVPAIIYIDAVLIETKFFAAQTLNLSGTGIC
jgi:hypothetical protein